MADESLVNGVTATEGEDQAADSFYDFDAETTKVSDLLKKVEVLEREKVGLAKVNEEVKEKEKKLEVEVLGLRSEKEKAEEDGKALGAIASRAADLETEVSRLQHDLVSVMSEGDDANNELVQVKKAFEESKVRVAELGKEKELIKERLLGEIEEVRKEKADIENKVTELENKAKGVAEDAKAESVVKEKQLNALNKKVEELKDVVSNDMMELDKEKAEKKVLKEALEASEAKVAELESKLIQLQKKAEEAEKVISKLKENTSEAVNGVIDRDYVLANDVSKKGTTSLQWAVGAGVSAVVIGGAICLLHARKR